MRALRFAQVGDLEHLTVEEVPDPAPSRGEVVVQVRAASLNPSDVKNVLGKMSGTTLPRTPGRDFAGVVIRGPDNLIGKEVWGTGGDIGFTRDGSHAEQIVVPAEGAAPKPKKLSMAEAASVGVTFTTAWLGIEALGLTKADTLLVTGAGGGVGSAVIQLAKWRGARVIAAVRNPKAEQHAREQGADIAFTPENSGPDQFISKIRELNAGHGANAVFDCVGGPLFEPCLRSLEHDGRQVNITSVGDRRVTFDLLDFYHHRLTLRGVDSHPVDTVRSAAILNLLAPGFESGALRPSPVTHQFQLEDGPEAYRQVDAGTIDGKAVFTMATTPK